MSEKNVVICLFLQTEGYSIKRNKLQLVGVTAMFLASKVEEMYAPEINGNESKLCAVGD